MESAPNAIDAEARTWVLRLDAGALSSEEQRALDAWVASDPRRHGALVRARAVWADADRLAALAAGAVPLIEPERRYVRRRAWLAAACLALLSLLVGIIWLSQPQSARTYVSEIGELRRIALPDGSELTLNTHSRAVVRFEAARRDVALEHGEALFKVAHDTARPFIVHARDVRVRAVGTAFTVRVENEHVDVVVIEGVVEMQRENGLAPERVSAGHRAELLSSASSRFDVESVSNEVIGRELAWREGRVAFAGEPMSVAIREINRYSQRTIQLDDPTLAAEPVVGIFRASDAEGFASAAAVTFGAEIVHVDGTIHLRRQKSSVQAP
ncbi:MAG: FecR domain-containing protein [Gammaproteobacteria bacterium]